MARHSGLVVVITPGSGASSCFAGVMSCMSPEGACPMCAAEVEQTPQSRFISYPEGMTSRFL